MKIVRVVTNHEQVKRYLIPFIFSYEGSQDELIIIGTGVSVLGSSYPWVKFIDVTISRKPDIVSDLKALHKLTRVLGQIRPDLVHSTFPKPGLLVALAAWFLKIEARGHTYTGQVWNLAKNAKFHPMFWSDFLIAKLSTFVLTDGQDQSKFLYDHGINHRGKIIPTIGAGSYCGVDFSFLDNIDTLPKNVQLNIKNKVVFSYIARKTIDKGAIDVLKAFRIVNKQIPDSCLLFVGPDESGKLLHDFLQNNKIPNIVHVDSVENVHPYLKATDIFCLPSYREGFSTIIIQSAAHGIPVLGYNSVGVGEPIRQCEIGITSPIGDVNCFAENMINLAKNKEMRKSLGLSGRVNALNKFNASIITNALKQFYITKISL